ARNPLVRQKSELRTVQRCEVDCNLIALQPICLPARVLDPVGGGAAVIPPGVAPVVLRDELLLAAGRDCLRLMARSCGERVPAAAHLPSILRSQSFGVR